MIYLASPYTHEEPSKRQERYLAVAQATVRLTRAGLHVFSPIVHGHALSTVGRLPTDWAFWEGFDTFMIKACTTFAVLQLPGWEASAGVQSETSFAGAIDRKPILVHPSRLSEAIEALRNAERAKGIPC